MTNLYLTLLDRMGVQPEKRSATARDDRASDVGVAGPRSGFVVRGSRSSMPMRNELSQRAPFGASNREPRTEPRPVQFATNCRDGEVALCAPFFKISATASAP